MGRLENMATGLLAGRLALVTGAGSGIGAAVCKILAREGAAIAAADLNKDGVAQTLSSLAVTDGTHRPYTADVSSSSSIEEMMTEIQQQFNTAPCIAVNCAGITQDNFVLDMNESQWDSVMNVNLKGTYLVNQAVGKAMQNSGLKNGSIVNISSIVGKVGNMGQANYAASKAGVVGLTKTVAKEYAKFGIRCNVILPGFIETPMVESVPEKVVQMLKMMIPLQRAGKPEEIAETCLFLASDQSSYITGATFEVTGGLNL